VAAAEAGKHILVEKPMARDAAEARRMIDASREAGVKLMVSQNFRYHPLVRRVKSLLGEIGRPYFISMCKRQQPAHGWREDPAASGGGALMDLGVHVFDQARFILDEEPTRASCFIPELAEGEIERSFASIFEFPGCLVACDASMCSGSRTDLIEVATGGRQLLADRYARRIIVVDGFDRSEETITQPDYTLGHVLGDFVRSIIEDTEPPVTGFDGLRAVEMAMACYESARRGEHVGV
jgi:predicted dehydrogenase